ncbi:MAG: hypothetical protein MR853_05740 [Selenomonadales bacterium]|nr:hypothetical protein [Selenomonadales bacterium]
MEFLAITAGIIAVCILAIQKIARLFSIELTRQSLVLCGVLAFIVNFCSISMSSYLTTTHFLLLGGLIIIASASATFYNRFLLSKKRTIPDSFVLPDEYNEANLEDEPTAEPELTAETEPIARAKESPQPASAPIPEPVFSQPIYDEPQEPAFQEPHFDDIPEPEYTGITIDDILTSEPAEETVETAAEDESVSFEASASYEEGPVSLEEAAASNESEQGLFSAEEEKPEDYSWSPEPIKAEEEEQIDWDEIAGAVAFMDTLDEILDYAFEQRNQQHFQAALYAYGQAMVRYENDDYAPFIVIEMINICKQTGAYSDAIASYRRAMELPMVASSPSMLQDFQRNLDYITIVNQVLISHNEKGMPFGMIPAEYMAEIESEFQKKLTFTI